MRWRKFSNEDAQQHLIALARTLKNRECGIVYSPYPAGATVAVIALPDWEMRAMRKNSEAANCEVMRFYDVHSIKITTQDTITVGNFKKLEYKRIGEKSICKLIVRSVDGLFNEVQFVFASCELCIKGGAH